MISSQKKTNALFFGFSPEEPEHDLEQRLIAARDAGFSEIIASYKTQGMKPAKFDETYFAGLDQLVRVCHNTGMHFWLEDYAPFPTGNANGEYQEEPYEALNKQFIDERHIDLAGPIKGAVARVDQLQKAVFGKTMHRFGKVEPAKRKRLSIVAYRLLDQSACAASPLLDESSMVLLDDQVHDGFLKWDVPEGRWRVFVLFETPESAGRKYFMNLLSRDSVALEIEKVHRPLYEHLRNELDKTWIGFFYDEPEIGNNGGDQVFDFFMLPGRRSQDLLDCDTLPWCAEMPEEMAKRDPQWLMKLPFLWYDSGERAKDFRASYMEAVSSLVCENYNGQVYAFCQERGIQYIGHVLEDEGCHDKLGCGPSHYFRQQYHQDEAGIDVIAGQILPGRDGATSWYGVPNADGEFYHYGLAKLASSESHINPLKKNRAFAEVFAMYGQQGMAERKFLIDHLLVNGVNRMLFMSEFVTTAREGYVGALLAYTDRMCAMMREAEPVQDVAVLYHAEMEWREGKEAGRFHRIGVALSRHQIGYDVIPADVFSSPEKYNAEQQAGLRVNGHDYQALIIPACKKLPDSVLRFVMTAKEQGFPVWFIDRVPQGVNAHPVALSTLPQVLKQKLQLPIWTEGERSEWLRASHVQYQGKEIFLLHNEAPQGSVHATIYLQTNERIYCYDAMTGEVFVPEQRPAENGYVALSMYLNQYELAVLCAGNVPCAHRGQRREAVTENWQLECPDGSIITDDSNGIPRPEAHVGYSFSGKISYRFTLQAEKNTRWIHLGDVSDCCELFVNEKSAGKRLAAPYLYDAKGLLNEGKNEIRAEVYVSAGNAESPVTYFGIPADALTSIPYCTVLPMGIQGPVTIIKEVDPE